MEENIKTEEIIKRFKDQLTAEEKSAATIEKYLRDIRAFFRCCGSAEMNKATVIAYKQKLLDEQYAARSVNSVLASLNRLFSFIGRDELRVKFLRIQQQVYCPEEKELTKSEYERLCRAAEKKKDIRLSLILQTLCSTGMRVSELPYITVEAVRKGEAKVSLKGKMRTVFLVQGLRKKLLEFIRGKQLISGPLFITKNGRPLSRTMIWREMKRLCPVAHVDSQKVFPHNLRHLFARIFYGMEKDIVKLADILGHSSINTTRVYIISTGFEHRRSMERLRLII